MAVDAFHLIGGATDISCYLRGQLLIAGSVVIVNCSATVAEQAKDGRVECVMGCLNGLLFDRDRLEAEPPRGIFQRSRRKMIDVFCIEFLERGGEIIDVSSCVRRFQIQITSRCEQAASGAKEFRDVVDVLEDVAEHNAVKLRHVGWSGSAGNRADVGLKATLATRSGTTRRRVKSGNGGESHVAESGEQASSGTAGIQNAGRARRQKTRNVGSGSREPCGVEWRSATASRGRRIIVLRPLAIEAVVIQLRSRRIGINEAAATAYDDIVFGRQRIAVRNHEALAMADRLAGSSAGCAGAMRLRTESGCAMHEPLVRWLWLTRSAGWISRGPKTNCECVEWRHVTELLRRDLILGGLVPLRAHSGVRLRPVLGRLQH